MRFHPEIFLSYAWRDDNEQGESREKIVNELQEALVADGYTVVRDKDDVKYRELFSDLTHRIGGGKRVVVVISDRYLKSGNCMAELLAIYRNSNSDINEMKKRIFPIVLDDAKIHDSFDILNYVSFWKTKKDELNNKILEVGLEYAAEVVKDFTLYNEITSHIATLSELLKDMKTLNPKLLSRSNFMEIKKAIESEGNKYAEESSKKLTIGSSPGKAIWLGIGLAASILLLIVFIPCPSSTQYFIFRIIIALAAASLIVVVPAVLKITLTSSMTVALTLCLFMIIYFFDPASSAGEGKCLDDTFSLTVYVHGKGGLTDKILDDQGRVCIYLNSRQERSEIDKDGKATFSEISPTFLGKKVLITIEHAQPYQSTHPDSLYLLQKNGVVYLETELMGMGKIFGEVSDYSSGRLLDSVRVSVLGIGTYTNSNGWFELNIPPDMQAKFQRVAFDKTNYNREVYDSVPVHTRRPFTVSLKKTSN